MRTSLSLSLPLLLLTAVAAAGCSAATDDAAVSPTTAVSTTVEALRVPAQNGVAGLGSGFDVETEEFRGDCLTGTASLVNRSQGTVIFDRSLSQEELRTALGLSGGGKASFGPFNVNGAAKFALSAENSRYSEAFVFMNEVSGVTYRLVDGHLSDVGERAKAQGSERATQACGTEFVSSVDLGARVFVSVKFEFADESVKSQFDASLKLDYLSLFSIEGAVQTAYERFASQVSIQISAYQMGGNPVELGAILRPTGDGIGTTSTAALVCSLKDLAACQNTIRNIAAYVSESFPAQVQATPPQEGSGTQLPPGYAILSYETKAYTNAGFGDLVEAESPIVGAAVSVARDTLLTRFRRIARDRQRVEALLSGNFRLTKQERSAIQSISEKLGRQSARIVETAQLCYTQLPACPSAVDELLRELDTDVRFTYDPDDLVKYPGFYEFCVDGRADVEARRTVAALAAHEGVIGRSCEEQADAIENANVFDLPGQPGRELSDMRPLRSAKELQYLFLRGNKVRDLAPLAALPKLKAIDLRSNGITNVGRLASMRGLKSLDLAMNNIRDLSPLAELRGLEIIKAHKNPVLDSAVLDGLPNLKVKLITDKDLCAAERTWLRDNGYIDAAELERFTRRDFAPVYTKPGNRESGIASWMYCPAVADELPVGL